MMARQRSADSLAISFAFCGPTDTTVGFADAVRSAVNRSDEGTNDRPPALTRFDRLERGRPDMVGDSTEAEQKGVD